MTLKFQPPNLGVPPSKYEALSDTLGKTVQSLPLLWQQYKLQKMKNDLQMAELEQKKRTLELAERENQSKYGVGQGLIDTSQDVAGEIGQTYTATPQEEIRAMGTEGYKAMHPASSGLQYVIVDSKGNQTVLPPGQRPFGQPAAQLPTQIIQQDAGGNVTDVQTLPPGRPVVARPSGTGGKIDPKNKTAVEQTLRLYETARDGLMAGLKASKTGPFAGRIPAVTAAQQTAEGGVAAMAPVLKQLFRVAGEGVFTDRDQALLLDMVPTRKDLPEARDAKIQNIDNIVRAKLGIPSEEPTPSPTEESVPQVGGSFNGQSVMKVRRVR